MQNYLTIKKNITIKELFTLFEKKKTNLILMKLEYIKIAMKKLKV